MNLTVKQKEWLLELWKASEYSPIKALSVIYDKPPTTVMRALEKKGLCKDIMGTFWKITEEGKNYAKTIY
ncbi:hypothetical protein [Enterobacter roggenkampii]|uniref:hypothetical protein n=1 Tax=Enterobacter roggenkampii TaxID=1812935 RepID=UPI0013305E93|nr:hypothetical protein [Enterobacter roggenkampii]